MVGTFQTLARAEVAAKQLARKGLQYSVEVYKRDARTFAVTLGGNLSYADAAARVTYARNADVSRDAYVRQAQVSRFSGNVTGWVGC